MADKIDNMAFDYTKQDNTHVDLFGMKEEDPRSEQIHNALMVAGFTPGLGNIADAVDAMLYAYEGEFGSAAISAAAMIPFVGQAVSAKKALKVAKKSGEKMITLYRGVDKWHPGSMVKDGKFIGGDGYTEVAHKYGTTVKRHTYVPKGRSLPKKTLWTTQSKFTATSYGRRGRKPFDPEPIVLEFEVPRSYLDDFASSMHESSIGSKKVGDWLKDDSYNFIFRDGLPKEFLTKVHK
tara:strand:+ start:646 stop:1353 length:708 start_codon:yes stop_codon:yes gene_type:complete